MDDSQIAAESALRASERRLRALLDAIPDVILRVDRQGKVLDYQAANCHELGLPTENFVNKNLCDVLPADVARTMVRSIAATMQTGKLQLLELRLPEADQQTPTVFEARFVVSGPDEVLAIVRNITNRTRADEQAQRHHEQLAHVGRLSTMGEMVAGIAHEINQPLYAIKNFSEACVQALGQGSDGKFENVLKWTRQITEQTSRAGEIIKRFGQFVRKTKSQRSTVAVNDLVRESVALLDFQRRHDKVKVQFSLGESGAFVLADRVQIQQVMVNLLRNSFEALEANHEDNRTVIVAVARHDDEVEVTITDNGPGFSEPLVAQMFDPFFTTKPDGIGMGLAISRSITEAHGGKLWASRLEGGGARFSISLPVATEAATDAR